jgi:phage terminase small subunit
MARKKTTASKRTVFNHKLKVLTLADGSQVKERYHNDRGAKPVYPKKKKDEEKVKKPVEDEYSKMKYPPPKRNSVFRETWAKFIRNVTTRDSFKEAHLATLEVLCDLYVEYKDLERIIRTEGRTYETVSQWGKTKKMHPAVGQLDKVRANIAKYTKQLDLFPKRDTGSEADGEEKEWE